MRYKAIPSGLFRRNREKLLHLLDKDSVAILHSNDQMVRNGDQHYPYRQNSDFFYLTGIEQEMSVLLLCPEHPEESKTEMLFIRKPDPRVEIWEGRKLTRDEAGKISGITSVHWLEEFEAISRELILNHTYIYCSSREHVRFRPEYPSRDERHLARLKEKYPLHQYKRLTPILWKLRLKKEPEELEMIREAIRITSIGFNRVLSMVQHGIREYEIEAVLIHEFIRNGASGHAYLPIIASGENACFLHYIRNDQKLQGGQLLLMDFGAEYGNYAADCSRTVPVSGQFTVRQREIYEACLRLFRFTRSLVRPGISISQINKHVWKQSEQEHIQLGLYTLNDVKEQKEDNPMYRKHLMHGVAHFLGLDVHDTGQNEWPLEEGMVLTCEPGIYIAGEKTGVRLENNLLVSKDGNIDLMKKIPLEPDEIESLMKSR